jgi:hypothetical protein
VPRGLQRDVRFDPEALMAQRVHTATGFGTMRCLPRLGIGAR